MSNQIVRFTSTHQEDIEEVMERGYWTHSKRPSKLKIGDTVYVVPNRKELDRGKILCVKGIAASLPMEVPAQVWTSTEDNTHRYVQQVDLHCVEWVLFHELPEEVRNANASITGIRYIKQD